MAWIEEKDAPLATTGHVNGFIEGKYCASLAYKNSRGEWVRPYSHGPIVGRVDAWHPLIEPTPYVPPEKWVPLTEKMPPLGKKVRWMMEGKIGEPCWYCEGRIRDDGVVCFGDGFNTCPLSRVVGWLPLKEDAP